MTDEQIITGAERAAAIEAMANDTDPRVYRPGEREKQVALAWKRKQQRRLARERQKAG